MAHLDVDFIAKGGGVTGLGIETTSGDMVLVKDAVIIGRWKSTGLDQQQPGEARGDLMRYGSSGWESLVAKTAGQLVAGDGTDVKSMPMTGEVTVAHAAGNIVATMAGAKVAGAQCVGQLDSVGVGADTETVTIGARVYELDTHDVSTITAGRVRVDVHGGSTVKAKGTLNINSQILNGETVTIDTKVYTFEDALTNVDGHVHISHVDASGTIDNLIAAIMLGAGSGTAYAAATTLHPTVTAAVAAGDTMTASAKAGGVGGNAIATLDGLSDVLSVWDAGTLGTTTAGVSPTALEVATALKTAINADASRVCDAVDVGDGTVLLVGKAAGATNHALAEATANVVVSAAACVGGSAAEMKTVHAIKRAITAADVTTLTDASGVVAIGGIPATSAPTLFMVSARTAAGVLVATTHVAFAWVQANSGWYALKATDSGAGTSDLANGDLVTCLCVE